MSDLLFDWCVDVNTAVPLVDHSATAEVLVFDWFVDVNTAVPLVDHSATAEVLVFDWCVDVNTAVPLVDQSDEAEVLATRPMSYVLAVDNGNAACCYHLLFHC